ncbi:uncharacterized [Tachysurus ichikawai]
MLEGEFVASPLLQNLNLLLSPYELFFIYILLDFFSMCTFRPSISAHKCEAAFLVSYCEKDSRVHKPPAADIQCSEGMNAGFSLSRTTDEENGTGLVTLH